ncbi:PhzF family phenazine biosynthesis protein [Nostocoides sp. Soil756]|uniref:PhzF family phenazine biosynthesis protein n=1 Tax=Nostocoides sp. Soil756 TaxID=1736399 RepID=UPI0006F61790|nr:PhzF family phenazine biosynthesis protein [Tetrasphaera sp. Soil756]KRE61625.1 phenazine biosynthesis protein PhzF [Tetrasphaera sp. Soil756]
MRDFRMVDVFSRVPFLGNALAVVHDADGLTDADMAAIARWTNLSETSFLCAPTRPDADYRVRIWTTGGELPFAGHPTLGSAHAWLEAGGVPREPGVVVQECAAGPVRVRRGPLLAFEAPPLVRSGPVQPADRDRVMAALGLDAGEVLEMAWVDNGPGWVGVLLEDPAALLARRVDLGRLDGLKVGMAARWPRGAHPDGCGLEVRAFYADGRDASEDPVTGSLNAGLAQWLVPAGLMPPHYLAAQGGAIGRAGRIEVTAEPSGAVLVGGATRTLATGSLGF